MNKGNISNHKSPITEFLQKEKPVMRANPTTAPIPRIKPELFPCYNCTGVGCPVCSGTGYV
jgi:hypothetical protein